MAIGINKYEYVEKPFSAAEQRGKGRPRLPGSVATALPTKTYHAAR